MIIFDQFLGHLRIWFWRGNTISLAANRLVTEPKIRPHGQYEKVSRRLLTQALAWDRSRVMGSAQIDRCYAGEHIRTTPMCMPPLRRGKPRSIVMLE